MHYFSTQIAWRSWTSLWGYPMILQDFIHPRWCRISSINSMFLRPRESWSRVFSEKKVARNSRTTSSLRSMSWCSIRFLPLRQRLHCTSWTISVSNWIPMCTLVPMSFFSTSTYFRRWIQAGDVIFNPGQWIPVIRGMCFFLPKKMARVTLEKWSRVKSQLTLQSETCWSCFYVKAKGILLKNLAFPCGWELWESDLPFKTIGDSN